MSRLIHIKEKTDDQLTQQECRKDFFNSILCALLLFACVVMLLSLIPRQAKAELTGDSLVLAQQWARIQYQMPEKDKEKALERLIDTAQMALEKAPKAPDLLIWNGIIASVYAGEVGGLTALKTVSDAKAYFERSLQVDPEALDGSAYTSLATLYYKVPSWPLSFGDSDKAKQLFKKALEINPDGMDSNFLYAQYLVEEEGRSSYPQAIQLLEKAQRAPARPDRPLADQGRQSEIQVLLNSLVE